MWRIRHVLKLAGNWEELQRSSLAVQYLADYNKSFAATLNTATATMRGSWEGNAADGAGLAAGAVQSLVDNTIIAMTILVASLAAKAGVVSAPASLALDAALAAQIVRIIFYFYNLIGLIGDIFTSAQGVVGTLMTLTAELSFADLKELPASGYKHPGVSI